MLCALPPRAEGSSSAGPSSSCPNSYVPKVLGASRSEAVPSTPLSSIKKLKPKAKKNKFHDSVPLCIAGVPLQCDCCPQDGLYHLDIEYAIKTYIPPLQRLPQKLVQTWRASEAAWNACNSPVSWDDMRYMFDPQCCYPVRPAVVDEYVRTMARQYSKRHGPGSGLVMDTRFYNKLSSFCHCSEGKHKIKENIALETALAFAGHPGARLFDHKFVFFPLELHGNWIGVFLDAGGTNIVFDPAGLSLTHECIHRLPDQLEAVLNEEVAKYQPNTPTVFDKSPFDLVYPAYPLSQSSSAIAVLCALEFFTQTGLSECLNTTALVFTFLSALMACGSSQKWEKTVENLCASTRKSFQNYFGHAGLGPKPKGPKGKKPKQLRARIANSNKPDANKLVLRSTSMPPKPIPTGDPAVDRLNEQVAKLAASCTEMKMSKLENKANVVTNNIEKNILDRVAWTVAFGHPPYSPEGSAAFLTAAIIKVNKGIEKAKSEKSNVKLD